MDAPENFGEERLRKFTDPIFITSAGLIITAPFLGKLFDTCDLFNAGVFKNKNSQCKAIQLCHYLATGNTSYQEHELGILKILCGLKATDAMESIPTITANKKEICDGLLTAITHNWKALNNTTIEGLRSSFLQREGKLEEEEDAYFLKVEQKSFDMLLDQIPWTINRIKLSWMPKIVNVQWR